VTLRAHLQPALEHSLADALVLSDAPARLVDVMRYVLLAPGKRIRPLLSLSVAHALAGEKDARALAMPAAVAVEMIHAYSLVHDDLPALDNDDLRRGRPTAHKAFGEAMAILAGDALQTHAFAVIADAPIGAAHQTRELAMASGPVGMVGGQVDDILAEGTAISVDELRSIHRRKTGKLFAAAAALGAIAVGASPAHVQAARDFGAALGFAFQVQDDVIDVTGDVQQAGKALGRDLAHDKATYVRLLGLPEAIKLAAHAGHEAHRCLAALGAQGPWRDELAAIVDAATQRRG
jgi:geranylgeranyl pyrophosphate synthase